MLRRPVLPLDSYPPVGDKRLSIPSVWRKHQLGLPRGESRWKCPIAVVGVDIMIFGVQPSVMGQLDEIYTLHGDPLLGMSVKRFLDGVN